MPISGRLHHFCGGNIWFQYLLPKLRHTKSISLSSWSVCALSRESSDWLPVLMCCFDLQSFRFPRECSIGALSVGKGNVPVPRTELQKSIKSNAFPSADIKNYQSLRVLISPHLVDSLAFNFFSNQLSCLPLGTIWKVNKNRFSRFVQCKYLPPRKVSTCTSKAINHKSCSTRTFEWKRSVGLNSIISKPN